MAELRECTFSPTFKARTLQLSEDFDTRSKKWQQNKEKKMEEVGVFIYE